MTLHHHYSNLHFNTCYTSRSHFFPPVNTKFKPTLPPPPPPPPIKLRWAHMASGPTTTPPRRKDKLLVIMGATGAGKSRLSLDLAAHFPLEILNSDKIQLYAGLDITTNKLPFHDRRGVPHHLLGQFDPKDGDFTAADFRAVASRVVSDVTSRGNVPVLVGGSNSFIHALVVDRFEPGSNVFEPGSNAAISSELRYNCCFLWVDMSLAVLTEYLSKRVDEMLDSGMLDELAEFCDQDSHSGDSAAVQTGLRRAIGVPEFTRYFKKYPPRRKKSWGKGDDRERREAYDEAVRAIKDNTCQLAKKQISKILRLREGGWDLQRLDATEAFKAVIEGTPSSDDGKRWSEIWERQVVEPSVKIVNRFLEE